MKSKTESRNSSPFLRGDQIANSILASDHLQSVLAKSANQVFKPWNNKYTPLSPQSPFGDFPKDYLKNVEMTRISPQIRTGKQILNQLTRSTSVLNTRMSPVRVNHNSPPKAGALERRLIAVSEFRRYYDRGDLPIKIDYSSGSKRVTWKTDPRQLDYHHYFPIFVDGIREKIDPYRFLSIIGTFDLIDKDEGKILPVIPQLVVPLKTNLNTRDPEIISITLRVLQRLVLSGDLIGEALVPYFRQLLPVLNIFKNCSNHADNTLNNGGMKSFQNLGDLIQETLEILEKNGGDDAYINIKYMIPTYESCLLS